MSDRYIVVFYHDNIIKDVVSYNINDETIKKYLINNEIFKIIFLDNIVENVDDILKQINILNYYCISYNGSKVFGFKENSYKMDIIFIDTYKEINIPEYIKDKVNLSFIKREDILNDLIKNL